MLDRLESIARLLCMGLGALLFLQLFNAVWRGDPLGHVTIPELPTISSAATGNTNAASAQQGMAMAKTNSEPAGKLATGQTNSGTSMADAKLVKTNLANVTNRGSSFGTNSLTNGMAVAGVKTNSSTNAVANSPRIAQAGRHHPGMPGPMGMPGPKVELPPDVQARVDRILQSEILGPVMHPMPMALLGIAGNDAFLRSPDGQTGMVKEGAELGSIKLLRIGTNRVLVEENGAKKELTLFAGMGGESLLPPETNSAAVTNTSANKKETH
jgi:hypothetical protein